MSDTQENYKLQNTLTSIVQGLQASSMYTPTINQQTPAMMNNRWNLLFNNRSLLSEMYIEHGLIQTLVDVPVDDAFSKGFEIKSEQLEEADIKDVMDFINRRGIIDDITEVLKWGRLFGGGGLVAMTGQNPKGPLNLDSINDATDIDFYAADLWELNMQHYSSDPTQKDLNPETPYMFHGMTLHKSRVFDVSGKRPPSLYRNKFRGWGMTVLEPVLRGFNQWIKNNNVIYELLDEAKIDVFKIKGFNNALLTPGGTSKQQERVQLAAQMKNYVNALTMDAEDDYDQKQMTFGGLGEMLQQIRINIACDLRIPMTKLFGEASTGFSSGQDSIENYNSMVEREVRAKSKPLIIHTVRIICAKLFGFAPDDIEIEFPPLRMLSAEQEENTKNMKLDRVLRLVETGLMAVDEAQEAINKGNLVDVKIDVTGEANPMFDNIDSIGMNKEDINSTSDKLQPKEV